MTNSSLVTFALRDTVLNDTALCCMSDRILDKIRQIWKLRFYTLVEPINTHVLVAICDHGVEDDAVFSTDDFDSRGGVGWRGKKNSVYLHLHIKRNHVDLWYIILHKISQCLAGNRACGCGFLHCVVLNFCLFSVKINDSPITLNSSFITAWYPGKRAWVQQLTSYSLTLQVLHFSTWFFHS